MVSNTYPDNMEVLGKYLLTSDIFFLKTLKFNVYYIIQGRDNSIAIMLPSLHFEINEEDKAMTIEPTKPP